MTRVHFLNNAAGWRQGDTGIVVDEFAGFLTIELDTGREVLAMSGDVELVT